MRNPFILLDAGGAFLLIIPVVMILFIVGIIFLEAWVLFAFRYNTFKRSLRDAMLANVLSLFVGIFCVNLFHPMHIDNPKNLLLLFVITLVTEGGLLLALSKGQNAGKTMLANVLMNVASYLILAFILFVLLR